MADAGAVTGKQPAGFADRSPAKHMATHEKAISLNSADVKVIFARRGAYKPSLVGNTDELVFKKKWEVVSWEYGPLEIRQKLPPRKAAPANFDTAAYADGSCEWSTGSVKNCAAAGRVIVKRIWAGRHSTPSIVGGPRCVQDLSLDSRPNNKPKVKQNTKPANFGGTVLNKITVLRLAPADARW